MAPAARAALTSQGSLQSFAIQPNTFLPFLYHTRTLQARRKQSRRSIHHDHLPRRPFSSTTHHLADHDAIPFEHTPAPYLPPDDPTAQGPALSYFRKIRQRPTQDTTITHTEKAVFDRIFKDIATASTVRNDNSSTDFAEENKGSYYENLDKIFDDAISQAEKQEEYLQSQRPDDSAEKKYARHPLLLKIPGLEHLAPAPGDWSLPGRIGSESISNLSTAHGQHRRKVYGMLDAAETDVAVWRVLENEVFVLIHELDNRVKAAEKAAKKEKTKMGRPSKKAGTEPKAEDNTTKALPPTVLLSILNTEYAHYVLAAARLLRRSFPTSAYALAILPEVKRLGPVSYVLGATANLYNETLYHQWSSKNDLHGMATLLQEMRTQGVESNDVTASFLQGVQRRRSYEMSGNNGVWRQKWWGMAPIEEAWGKLKGEIDHVLEEQRERAMKFAEEDRKAKDEAEGELDNEARDGEEGEVDSEPFTRPDIQADA